MSWLRTIRAGLAGTLPAIANYVLFRSLRGTDIYVFCLCCGRVWHIDHGVCPTGCPKVFSTICPPRWVEDEDIRKAILHRFVVKVGEGEKDIHYGLKKGEGYGDYYDYWVKFINYGEDFVLADDLHNARPVSVTRAEVCSRDIHRAIRPPKAGCAPGDESLNRRVEDILERLQRLEEQLWPSGQERQV